MRLCVRYVPRGSTKSNAFGMPSPARHAGKAPFPRRSFTGMFMLSNYYCVSTVSMIMLLVLQRPDAVSLEIQSPFGILASVSMKRRRRRPCSSARSNVPFWHLPACTSFLSLLLSRHYSSGFRHKRMLRHSRSLLASARATALPAPYCTLPDLPHMSSLRTMNRRNHHARLAPLQCGQHAQRSLSLALRLLRDQSRQYTNRQRIIWLETRTFKKAQTPDSGHMGSLLRILPLTARSHKVQARP